MKVVASDLMDSAARFVAAMVPSASPGLSASLMEAVQTVQLRSGEAFRIEDGRDRFAYVDHGAAKLVARASGGREQVVAFHFAGDLVWVPSPAAHEYRLCALTQSSLVTIPAGHFLAAIRDDAAAMAGLFERTRTALLRSRDKSVSLGRKSAQERIADFLTGMATRIGTGDPRHPDIELAMSRRDIADSLGLTIETVSRQFSELRAASLIETRGRSHVHINDPRGLVERAGHVPRPD